jgi:hypothetical protein
MLSCVKYSVKQTVIDFLLEPDALPETPSHSRSATLFRIYSALRPPVSLLRSEAHCQLGNAANSPRSQPSCKYRHRKPHMMVGLMLGLIVAPRKHELRQSCAPCLYVADM